MPFDAFFEERVTFFIDNVENDNQFINAVDLIYSINPVWIFENDSFKFAFLRLLETDFDLKRAAVLYSVLKDKQYITEQFLNENFAVYIKKELEKLSVPELTGENPLKRIEDIHESIGSASEDNDFVELFESVYIEVRKDRLRYFNELKKKEESKRIEEMERMLESDDINQSDMNSLIGYMEKSAEIKCLDNEELKGRIKRICKMTYEKSIQLLVRNAPETDLKEYVERIKIAKTKLEHSNIFTDEMVLMDFFDSLIGKLNRAKDLKGIINLYSNSVSNKKFTLNRDIREIFNQYAYFLFSGRISEIHKYSGFNSKQLDSALKNNGIDDSEETAVFFKKMYQSKTEEKANAIKNQSGKRRKILDFDLIDYLKK